MSDIVERLRNPALVAQAANGISGTAVAVLDDGQTRADMAEAADVIERLRAELTGLRAVAGAVSPGPSLADIKHDPSWQHDTGNGASSA